MLKLLDAQDLLEHLIQLVLTEDELRGGTCRHPLLVLPGVLFPTIDGIKLRHPGAQHRLFAEAIDLRQTADPLLYVLLKNLTGVARRAASALHHPGHAVTFQEDLQASWEPTGQFVFSLISGHAKCSYHGGRHNSTEKKKIKITWMLYIDDCIELQRSKEVSSCLR